MGRMSPSHRQCKTCERRATVIIHARRFSIPACDQHAAAWSRFAEAVRRINGDKMTMRERDIMQGVLADVAEERDRQIREEPGRAPEQDDQLTGRQLMQAAVALGLCAGNLHDMQDGPPSCWPFGLDKWRPINSRADFIRMIAYAVAEVERLDRAAQAATAKGNPANDAT